MTITAEAPYTTDVDAAEVDVEALRAEIDQLDAQILAHVRRRVEITRRAGIARIDAGLPKVAHTGEMDALKRFERHLGREGVSLALVLIRLGRSGVPHVTR